MIKFRLPNWMIYLSIVLNLILAYFCIVFEDWSGILLCVFCLSCFIITYRINERERNEEAEKEKQGD